MSQPASWHDRIGALITPSSVVVIGASPTSSGPGSMVFKNLLKSPLGARVYAVNERYADEPGFFSTMAALPEIPDVAVIAVPAANVIEVITAASNAGVISFVVLSSGFAESGADGRLREAVLVELARRRGLAVLGPNSLGVLNFHTRAHMSFATAISDRHETAEPIGNAALITQSGAVGSYLCGMAAPRMPFRFVISTGNEACCGSTDLIAYLATDPDVKIIAAYLEGIADGRAILEAVAAATMAGKHLIILPAGESPASARAASSHTAALTSSNTLTRGLAADAGAYIADTPEQLLGTVIALQRRGGAQRRGVGVVSVSGGAAVIATDRLTAAGLDLATPHPQTIQRLESLLPAYGTPGNPTDTTAAAIYKPEILTGALCALAADPGIGQLLTIIGAGGQHAAALANAVLSADAAIDIPHQVVWLACPSDAKDILAAGHLPVDSSIADAVGIAKTLYRPRSPQPVPPGTDGQPAILPIKPLGDANGFLTEQESRELLRASGLPIALATFLPADRTDTHVDTLDVEFPVAVKIQAHGVSHKTEIGGVVVDVRDHAELRKAIGDTEARARQHLPGIIVEGWNIEPMAPRGIEVLVGCRVDPTYGAVVTIGAGGVYTELIADVATTLGPVTRDQARILLSRTKVGNMLDGFRGRRTDLQPLCDFVAQLSRLIIGNSPIHEIECNPVIVGLDGHVTVVDTLVRLEASARAIKAR